MDPLATTPKGCKDLNVLIVEDSASIRMLYQILFTDSFKNIFYAHNGEEGIDCFENNPIDIIICDQVMPVMTGLEMIRRLKKKYPDIAVIFVTSSNESETLVEAINLQVSHFLLKPFTKESLEKAVKDIMQPIIFKQELDRHTQHYLNALKEYEIYNTQEQKKAFAKQSNAIKNDYYYQYIQYKDKGETWHLNAFYKPFEILNGDAYSVRKISDKKLLLFMIDAMGKGVSASISCIIALTMINNFIDLICINQRKELKDLISVFIRNINTMLIEEEIISVLFAEIDIETENMLVASYGMPPILLMDRDKKVLEIRSNNPPIASMNNTEEISSHSLRAIEKIFFASDGVFEARLPDERLYFQSIKKDFLRYNERSTFVENFLQKITHLEDDVSMLFISRNHEYEHLQHKNILSTLKSSIDESLQEFELFLEKEKVSLADRSKLFLLATELLTNAYEHGNLGISQEEKALMVEESTLEIYCKTMEERHQKKKIFFDYGLVAKEHSYYLLIKIEDEGNGFDSSILKQQVFAQDHKISGRGFKMAKKISDALYYSPKGNTVIANKLITKVEQ